MLAMLADGEQSLCGVVDSKYIEIIIAIIDGIRNKNEVFVFLGKRSSPIPSNTCPELPTILLMFNPAGCGQFQLRPVNTTKRPKIPAAIVNSPTIV